MSTERTLRVTRATLGDLHPATWAAYGRAVAAWGEDRVRTIKPRMPPLSREFPIAARAALITAKHLAIRRARA